MAGPAKAPPLMLQASPQQAPTESVPAKTQPPKVHARAPAVGRQSQSAESALAKTPPPTDPPPNAVNYALDEHGEVATTYSEMTDEDIFDTIWGRRLHQPPAPK